MAHHVQFGIHGILMWTNFVGKQTEHVKKTIIRDDFAYRIAEEPPYVGQIIIIQRPN